MNQEQETSWLPRPLLLIKWGFLAFAIAALWLAVNYHRVDEYFEARVRRNEIRETVETMDRQYSHLLREKHELEKWGFSSEKAIREKLKMIRPGERVILIEESDFTASSVDRSWIEPESSSP